MEKEKLQGGMVKKYNGTATGHATTPTHPPRPLCLKSVKLRVMTRVDEVHAAHSPDIGDFSSSVRSGSWWVEGQARRCEVPFLSSVSRPGSEPSPNGLWSLTTELFGLGRHRGGPPTTLTQQASIAITIIAATAAHVNY